MEIPAVQPGFLLVGWLKRKEYFAVLQYIMEEQKKSFHEIAMLIAAAIFFIAVFLKIVFF
jgi:hypothetical protein